MLSLLKGFILDIPFLFLLFFSFRFSSLEPAIVRATVNILFDPHTVP